MSPVDRSHPVSVLINAHLPVLWGWCALPKCGYVVAIVFMGYPNILVARGFCFLMNVIDP